MSKVKAILWGVALVVAALVLGLLGIQSARLAGAQEKLEAEKKRRQEAEALAQAQKGVTEAAVQYADQSQTSAKEARSEDAKTAATLDADLGKRLTSRF